MRQICSQSPVNEPRYPHAALEPTEKVISINNFDPAASFATIIKTD